MVFKNRLKNEKLSTKSLELLSKVKAKKALLINNVKIDNLKELEKFSQMFGKLLNYGKKLCRIQRSFFGK